MILPSSKIMDGIGHGTCFVSPDNKFAYLNIHKNGSTFLRNLLNEWVETNIDNLSSNITILIVLREDIILRWVSGLVSLLQLRDRNYSNIDDIVCDIFKRISFDIHTETQCSFLQNLEPFKKIFFKLDIDFTNKFIIFLNNNGYYIDNIPRYKNSIKQHSTDEIYLYEQIKNYALMPVYNKKLIKFFKDDYELIENTTFYNN